MGFVRNIWQNSYMSKLCAVNRLLDCVHSVWIVCGKCTQDVNQFSQEKRQNIARVCINTYFSHTEDARATERHRKGQERENRRMPRQGGRERKASEAPNPG
jgi:hypothetical protein